VTNRWLRFVLALIAITAIAAAGYRIYQDERHLTSDTRALNAGTDWADTAIETVGELRAALHAYVAPGQAHALWTSRAATMIDKLRNALLELDRATSAIGAPLTGTLDLSDRLSAAEQRAREHARAGQPLLAGDAIFTDARDLLDAIRLQVAAARGRLGQQAETRYLAVRRQQVMWAIGAVAVATFVLVVLVPPVSSRANGTTAATETSPAADLSSLDEYARVIPTRPATPAVPAAPAGGATPATAKPPAATTSTSTGTASTTTPVPSSSRPAARSLRDGIVSAEVMAARSAAGLEPSHSTSARVAPTSAPAAFDGWRDTAALCTDLARVADSQEIPTLLARAAALLNASGLVVWMASEGGLELCPAVTTGYDDRLIALMGTISREADNVTAAAFRDGLARTSAARPNASAALAVPLLTPAGAVGVLSAEIRDVPEIDPQRQALASILSAQLATLLGSSAAAEPLKHGTSE
jgi:hypothetical protein